MPSVSEEEERMGLKMNSDQGRSYWQMLELGTKCGRRQEPAETDDLSVSNWMQFVMLRRGPAEGKESIPS